MKKSELMKKRRAYEKSKQAKDFHQRYGNEREYGKSIMREEELKEKVIKLQNKKYGGQNSTIKSAGR